jgi:hypothetical protein
MLAGLATGPFACEQIYALTISRFSSNTHPLALGNPRVSIAFSAEENQPLATQLATFELGLRT